ncbi:elongation factor P 5-aminopentanone reductase [Parasporobacterium paucivorans]|uniref:3-oxoacyl-[acyl-carrier protein] reductase n=1 Tax=Parasporobacterium paucivorans DSM 15970 TaxID=1122934 RepID=A0A1M6LE13_9FIRM|nr:3-oxoacyl-ACP reductase FabG [Parasporobacterium paucivorans]SHJ69444.1 3-oxoacyl-[acyl-carrier protein] reductase [Parasporobacterium paucivorans DSM 15970]
MKKTALVSGASRGIGKSTALAFASAGYNLVITSLNSRDMLEDTRCEIQKMGMECHTYLGDMGSEENVTALFEELKYAGININVLVNNAGISHFGLLQDMTMEEWNRVLSTNLTSAFLLSKYVLPDMIRNKKGKIVNISSVWGASGASYEVAYSASKGGLNSFTRSLAKELAPSNIQVNAIACGIIDTDMNRHLSTEERREIEDEIPAGRSGSASEVADMVLKVVESPEYLTGQIITLSGGWY